MTVSLVAIVGADGNIGPTNGLPVFADHHERSRQGAWFDRLSEGSIVVIGGNTAKIARGMGFNANDGSRDYAVWSRSIGQSPEDFLAALRLQDRHIIIAGGAKTFRVFAPFCDNYYLRRVALLNPPDFRLWPVLSSWQSRIADAEEPSTPRMS